MLAQKGHKKQLQSIRKSRKRLRGIFFHQQEADKKFLEAGEARERRELEREKRRKDDQEFLLQLRRYFKSKKVTCRIISRCTRTSDSFSQIVSLSSDYFTV